MAELNEALFLARQAIFSGAREVIKQHRCVTYRFQLLTPLRAHIYGCQFRIGSVKYFIKRDSALVRREILNDGSNKKASFYHARVNKTGKG